MTSEEKIAALEKINGKLQGEVQLLSERLTTLQQGMVSAALRTAAKNAGVHESAVDDVLMRAGIFEVTADGGAIRAKESVGVTPGITPEMWLAEMRAKSPHWWPAPKSNREYTENPWTASHWNLTRQGAIYRESPERAERLAKAAGLKIGDPRPAQTAR